MGRFSLTGIRGLVPCWGGGLSRAAPASTRSGAGSSRVHCALGGSMDDVVLNKAATIERCVRRIREEHAGDDRRLIEDITRQDSIVLNLQRACEAAIDLAMHLVLVPHL